MLSSRSLVACSASLRLPHLRLGIRPTPRSKSNSVGSSPSAYDPLFVREPLPHPSSPPAAVKSTPPEPRPQKFPRPSLSLPRSTPAGPSAPGQAYTPPTVVKPLEKQYPQWVGNPNPAPKPRPPPAVVSPDRPRIQIASRKFLAEDAIPWDEWERTRTEELETKISEIEAPEWGARGLEQCESETERAEKKGKMRYRAIEAARKAFGRRRRDALARRELMRAREEEEERKRVRG